MREALHIWGKMGQRWRSSDVPSEHTFAWVEVQFGHLC